MLENNDNSLKEAIGELQSSRESIEQSQKINTTSQPAQSINLAGFWIRVGAAVIDGIILYVVNAVLIWILYYIWFFSFENVIIFLVSGAYFIISHYKYGQTLGKRMLKLKVVDEQGMFLTPTKATIRYIGKNISFYLLCIGVIWVAFDKKKQGWHDKMVNSFVIKIN